MSVEIDWEALTTGAEGAALAESIRTFIHDKFQEVDLPRFVRAVQVHAFEFGDASPSIVIKDIGDPLPDFYEDDDDDDDPVDDAVLPAAAGAPADPISLRARRDMAPPPLNVDAHPRPRGDGSPMRPPLSAQLSNIAAPLPRLQSHTSLADQLASPLLSRSSTPGIPGGTSSLSYFHLPLAHRLPGGGAHSPFAAVAGWQEHQAALYAQQRAATAAAGPPLESPPPRDSDPPSTGRASDRDPSTRPSTAHSQHHPPLAGLTAARADHASLPPSPHTPPPPHTPTRVPDPNDLQIVLHIAYRGNVRLALTAEILLDYPMPSFVGIPLKLTITGVSFDGVALLALLHARRGMPGTAAAGADDDDDRRAHFCFLGADDAEMLVGAANLLDAEPESVPVPPAKPPGSGAESLLREMRVESEIGRTSDGRQNLKNVGKVEKFVLEQVRRIFEEEFVYPSFWTFLV